jgi:F0F1-type ATP synthase epsilon subunit
MKVLVTSIGHTQFDGEAVRVTAPGVSGVFTVLPHHTHLVSALKAGVVSVEKADGSSEEYEVGSGILTTNGAEVVVLGLPQEEGV